MDHQQWWRGECEQQTNGWCRNPLLRCAWPVVRAQYDENVEPAKGIMLNGGVVCLVVCDKNGNRRTLYLSKDNLCCDTIRNAGHGKFMYAMMQAQRKSNEAIPGKILWGTFCVAVASGTKQAFVVWPLLSVLEYIFLFLPLFWDVVRGGRRMLTETKLIAVNEISFDFQLALFEECGCGRPMLKLQYNSLILMSWVACSHLCPCCTTACGSRTGKRNWTH